MVHFGKKLKLKKTISYLHLNGINWYFI